MIWIIGGTKDSRIILDEVMKAREDDIVVSTATEYGAGNYLRMWLKINGYI